MSKSFKLNGVDELEKLFKQLPPKIGENVVVSSLRKGARPIAKEAKRLVPVGETGDLKKSITVAAVKKRRRTINRLVFIGIKKPSSRIAHLIEFGTSRAPAQPFLRPALAAKGEAAIKVIAEAMADGINKAAIKLGQSTGATRKK